MDSLRSELIDSLNMLAHIDRQKEYHRNVPIADVPSELISAWFDSGFYPDDEYFRNLFSDQEWMWLCKFNEFYEARISVLPERFEDLMECKEWLDIVHEAKLTLNNMREGAGRTA